MKRSYNLAGATLSAALLVSCAGGSSLSPPMPIARAFVVTSGETSQSHVIRSQQPLHDCPTDNKRLEITSCPTRPTWQIGTVEIIVSLRGSGRLPATEADNCAGIVGIVPDPSLVGIFHVSPVSTGRCHVKIIAYQYGKVFGTGVVTVESKCGRRSNKCT